MSPPLIHIGYHRTGSTWLQRYLFASEAAGYLSPFPRDTIVRDSLVAPHPLAFEPARAAAAFAPGLDAAAARGLVPVISAERLSGYPDSGGYDSKEIAARLAAVFPDGRLLIVIREQRGIILSCYKVYVRAGGDLPLQDWLHPPARGRMRGPHFDFGHFAYDRLARHYVDLLGRDRVLVIAFEDLIADAAGSVARIAGFAGGRPDPDLSRARPVNRSLSGLSVGVKRRLNPFIARDAANGYSTLCLPGLATRSAAWFEFADRYLPRAWSRPADARLARRVRDHVGDRYKESNRRMSALMETDLGERGYDT